MAIKKAEFKNSSELATLLLPRCDGFLATVGQRLLSYNKTIDHIETHLVGFCLGVMIFTFCMHRILVVQQICRAHRCRSTFSKILRICCHQSIVNVISNMLSWCYGFIVTVGTSSSSYKRTAEQIEIEHVY